MAKEVEYKTFRLFRNVSKVLKPPPKLLVSDWADEYRRLPAEASAEPGKWKTSRAEFQREIMNSVNDPTLENIVIKSSAQIGKSEILINIIGYFIAYDPAPMLMVQPTLEMAEAFSKDRIAPTIRDTPTLSEKVGDPMSRSAGNTILHKKFPGGHLTLAGSNSPASLASRPVRIVLLDETDRYPPSAGTEGDPIKLAEKRSNNFWNRKKIKVSTPTIKGASPIDAEYSKGTMEEWSVQCQRCGTWQTYDFWRIDFKDVKMACKSCKAKFAEREWKSFAHCWIPQNHHPNSKTRSFHLNELASPWRHWEEIIEEYRDAVRQQKKEGRVEKLKTFFNTVLGECWEDIVSSGTDQEDLLARREEYGAEIPDGVVVLTAGVDVQDDRLECEIVGWNEQMESWGIRKVVIRGDTALDTVWEDLEILFDTELHFPSGNGLNIAAMCVDTGGHNTNRVYKFVNEMHRKRKKIWGIKGYSRGQGIPFLYKKTAVEIKNEYNRKIGETSIYILGVDAGKEDVVARIKIKEPGPGFCHFPLDEALGYDQAHMEGLLSEVKVSKIVNGRSQIKWVKKQGVPNEPLDIRNYAYAAEQLLRPNYSILREKLRRGLNYTAQKTVVSAPKRRQRHGKGVDIYGSSK